jgi:hypothetical protein
VSYHYDIITISPVKEPHFTGETGGLNPECAEEHRGRSQRKEEKSMRGKDKPAGCHTHTAGVGATIE